MKSRREWGQWCAAALLATRVTSANAQKAGAGHASVRRLVVAVDDKTALAYLPLTIADRLGYFLSEGIALEIKEHADAPAAWASVQGGSAQLFSGAYAFTLAQRARDEYLASFVLQGLAPQIVFGVSQRTLKAFRFERHLRGRRVGVTALGSASHHVAQLVLARGGLTDTDVRFVALPDPAAALAAFQRGELDAIAYPDPLITRLEQAGELRILVDTRTVRGSEALFGGPYPAACLAAPAAWLAANADLCQGTANAMVHAMKWLQTAGPSDINKAVPESYFQGDRALYLAAFERTRESWAPDGMMPPAGPGNVAKMMARFAEEPLAENLNVSSTYTNQFAIKAKARFRA
jgi:NitT/TauT family transport system substrate-binding protein